MGEDSIAAQLLAMLAQERGLPRDKLHPEHRLREDLGMDGDDAVYFFRAVATRFGTDLRELYQNWNAHFGTEGLSLQQGLIWCVAGGMGGWISGVAGAASPLWGLAVAAAGLMAWDRICDRWGPAGRVRPITVADLLAAVAAGAWPAPSAPPRPLAGGGGGA